MRVGKFSENECLLQNIFRDIMFENPGVGHGPPYWIVTTLLVNEGTPGKFRLNKVKVFYYLKVNARPP